MLCCMCLCVQSLSSAIVRILCFFPFFFRQLIDSPFYTSPYFQIPLSINSIIFLKLLFIALLPLRPTNYCFTLRCTQIISKEIKNIANASFYVSQCRIPFISNRAFSPYFAKYDYSITFYSIINEFTYFSSPEWRRKKTKLLMFISLCEQLKYQMPIYPQNRTESTKTYF